MDATQKAGDLLIFYMAKAWEAAGLHWGGDNDSEARAIVDLIVKATQPGPASEARYVLADGAKYRETRVTVVPKGDGSAVVYEGTEGVTGPVFDGPTKAARQYAADRHGDLTAKGYVIVTA